MKGFNISPQGLISSSMRIGRKSDPKKIDGMTLKKIGRSKGKMEEVADFPIIQDEEATEPK